MANKISEQKKYDCDERLDGEKLWNFFNPPTDEISSFEFDARENMKKMIIGIMVAVVALFVKLFLIKGIPFSVVLVVIVVAAVFSLINYLGYKKNLGAVEELKKRIVEPEEYDKMENLMKTDIALDGAELMGLTRDGDMEALRSKLYKNLNNGYPFVLSGPRTKEPSITPDDGKTRYAGHDSTVFYCAEDALYVYEHSFSMLNKHSIKNTLILFYTDVVSVSTSALQYADNAGKKSDDLEDDSEDTSFKIAWKTLKISTTGGQIHSYNYIDSDEMFRNICSLQNIFREKKSQVGNAFKNQSVDMNVNNEGVEE